jgi:hypothetical protein
MSYSDSIFECRLCGAIVRGPKEAVASVGRLKHSLALVFLEKGLTLNNCLCLCEQCTRTINAAIPDELP